MASPAARPDWLELHHRALLMDIHAHPSLMAALFQHGLRSRRQLLGKFLMPLITRTRFPALQAGGVDVMWSAVYVPEKPLLDIIPLLKVLRWAPWPSVRHAWRELMQPPYFSVAQALLDEAESRLDAHNQATRQDGDARRVLVAHSLAELSAIVRQGDIAFIHTVEGGHAVDGGEPSDAAVIANLEALFARGVASLTLAHFYPNRLAMPVFPFPEYTQPILLRAGLDELWRVLDLTQGLTPLGCAVVERMLQLGMLVDVSHCTPAGRRQVYELADAAGAAGRVVASHVGAFAINPTPYNLEDWEIRWFAERGGVIGVIFMNYWLAPWRVGIGLDLIAATVEHLIRAAGGATAHVALGSDFDGFTDPPDDLKDPSELPRLTQRLLAGMRSLDGRKLSDADVEGILGRNALRVLREGWGKVE